MRLPAAAKPRPSRLRAVDREMFTKDASVIPASRSTPAPAPAIELPATSPPALRMAGVALAIDGIAVLHDVSLTLHAGEIYGLLGPNGAGKSTVIAAAMGALPHQAGTIELLGLDPGQHRHEAAARVGLLPQRLDLDDRMTARDYLHAFARGRRHETTDAAIACRLAAIGLDPGSARPIGTYSQGMRQKLGIARALVTEPKLVILDEPFAGLDPEARQQIHDLLIRLAVRHRTAVLLCTQFLDHAEALCARIGVMVAGRTLAQETVAELLHDRSAPAPHAAADWPDMPPAGGDHRLLAAGWPSMDVCARPRDLADLYFALTRKGVASHLA